MDHQTSTENRKDRAVGDIIGWIMMVYAIVLPVYCKYCYTELKVFPSWLNDYFTLIKSWPIYVLLPFYFIVIQVLRAAHRRKRLEKFPALPCSDETALTDSECSCDDSEMESQG